MTEDTSCVKICQSETLTLSDKTTLMFLFHEQKLNQKVWGIEKTFENFGIEVN